MIYLFSTKFMQPCNNQQLFNHLNFADYNFWSMQDFKFMSRALQLAKIGALNGEVPVGAVLVANDQIIGEGFNQPINSKDPTAHAEIMAIRMACRSLKNYRLPKNTILYVTLEPCTMCFGALIHSRLARIVYSTTEPRAGAVGSQLNLDKMDFYNHKVTVESGLLAYKSQSQLKEFFKLRRAQKKNVI